MNKEQYFFDWEILLEGLIYPKRGYKQQFQKDSRFLKFLWSFGNFQFLMDF